MAAGVWPTRVSAPLPPRIAAYPQASPIHSPLLSRHLRKVRVINPPVEVAELDGRKREPLQGRHLKLKGPVIGMAARLATEKGVEVLLRALPGILQRHPEAQVLFAGQHEDVLGEAEYARRLAPQLEGLADHWAFLGVLDPHEMAAFYRLCDVTVLPSLNSTEGFGLVQIESMISGTPVVASDLPGVRQPVLMTGMGKVAPVGNSEGLCQAILEVIEHPASFRGDPKEIAQRFSPQATAEAYLGLFDELLTKDAPR